MAAGGLRPRGALWMQPVAMQPGHRHPREAGLWVAWRSLPTSSAAGATGCRGPAPVASLAVSARSVVVTREPWCAMLLQLLPRLHPQRARPRPFVCSWAPTMAA
eukprot:7874821-Alexandrium_andersonii.AAC.1